METMWPSVIVFEVLKFLIPRSYYVNEKNMDFEVIQNCFYTSGIYVMLYNLLHASEL